MTLRELRFRLRAIDMTLRHVDGECRVNFRGGTEETAYYTTDRDDAWRTAIEMKKWKDAQ